jgi:hypothetical protein
MAEHSHREEMNAVIRAQRERQGTAPPAPEPTPPQPKPLVKLMAKLRGK